MSMKDSQKILALSYFPHLGIQSLKKIVEHFKDVETVWSLSYKELNSIKGLRKETLEAFQQKNKYLELAHKELAFAKENQISVLPYNHKNYPSLLKECVDSPPILFSKGNIEWDKTKFIAVVGTRQMTKYGKDFVSELIAGFQGLPITIVSGLAYGIDIEAHRAAIKGNLQTIAVLAHTVSKIYPRSNSKEAIAMQQNGGLVSEFSSFHKALPENFIRRNRIIAGLCDATIVIESGIKGGAMSTARCANLYNRDVFTVPGRISDTHSKGCNHLIKSHQAFLITEAQDVLQFLNFRPKKKKNAQKVLFVELNQEQQQLVDFITNHGKQHIDQLALISQKSTYQLLPTLLELELKNVITPLPGKFYDLL